MKSNLSSVVRVLADNILYVVVSLVTALLSVVSKRFFSKKDVVSTDYSDNPIVVRLDYYIIRATSWSLPADTTVYRSMLIILLTRMRYHISVFLGTISMDGLIDVDISSYITTLVSIINDDVTSSWRSDNIPNALILYVDSAIDAELAFFFKKMFYICQSSIYVNNDMRMRAVLDCYTVHIVNVAGLFRRLAVSNVSSIE